MIANKICTLVPKFLHMKYSIVNLGTLRVNAFEMIMGVPEESIRNYYSVDENRQMRIFMNSLVVETGSRIVCFDPGCADFLPKALQDTYDLKMEKSFEEAFEEAGYSLEDITDVVFTHLHFDHGGGAFRRIVGGIVKTFPNANYIVSRKQQEYISTLSSEESSSFFHKLLRFAGELIYFEDQTFEGLSFEFSDGHTHNLLLPVLDAGDHDVLFASDLIPLSLHMEKGSWSYYDEQRELLEEERQRVLKNLRPGSNIIYYHEPSS